MSIIERLIEKISIKRLAGVAIVPFGLTIVLVPLSLFIGWNVVTLILFWFILTPLSAIYLPAMLSKSHGHIFESILGLVIFYGVMVFMIYKHYKTDYFKVMMVSFVINIAIVTVVALVKRRMTQTTDGTMNNRLDILTQHYFPFHIILLGIACIPLIIIPVHLVLSVGLSVVVILIFTTHYRLELDRGSNTYKDYLWIVGLRKGETLPLPDVEHVFVNRVQRESEYGLVARLSVRKVIFSGYVRLANNEPLFIGESSKEEKLLKKAERIAEFLNVEIRKNY